MKKFLAFLLAAVMATALLAGCGAQKGGTVATDGSTSMEKVINALGESFMQNNSGTTFTYGNDADIVLIGREAGSGTRDGFESITDTKDKCQYRQELTSTGDVITAVSQNPNAIGYASLSAVKDSVKALTVGGVAPTEATVKDGSYVVQRPFVLVTKDGTKLSDTAQKFFDFATSADAVSIINQAGAVAAK